MLFVQGGSLFHCYKLRALLFELFNQAIKHPYPMAPANHKRMKGVSDHTLVDALLEVHGWPDSSIVGIAGISGMWVAGCCCNHEKPWCARHHTTLSTSF